VLVDIVSKITRVDWWPVSAATDVVSNLLVRTKSLYDLDVPSEVSRYVHENPTGWSKHKTWTVSSGHAILLRVTVNNSDDYFKLRIETDAPVEAIEKWLDELTVTPDE
jgi:hypothetical protein